MRIGSKFSVFGVEFEVKDIIVEFTTSDSVTKIICSASDGLDTTFTADDI